MIIMVLKYFDFTLIRNDLKSMDVFIIRNAFWDISLRSIRVSNVVAHPRSCCFGSRLKLFFVCLFNAKNTGGTKAAP